MKKDTVEVLTAKGQFEIEQALAVAEAIDMTIHDGQLVTTPILDARFQALESKVDARFQALESKVDARFQAFESKVDARFQAFESKVDAKFSVFEARIDSKFERFRTQLIIAILVGYAAMGPVGNAALEALKRAF